jgi:hypothetical protein
MLLRNVWKDEWREISSRPGTGSPLVPADRRRRERIMDLDELYVLLAAGAAAPYVVGATVDWMEHSGCAKSIGKFLRGQFSQLQN